jgi:F420-dependent oxidoreductase-like protein
MRISINIGGDVKGMPTAPREVAEQAVAAEAAGFPAAWTTHFMRGTDSFPTIAVAGARTSTIDLGIGIVPTYPRHPYTMAHEAATVQSLIGGRLTLGIGVSHKPIMEGMLGFDFSKPAAHLREYLQVLGPLLRTGEVSHHGERFDVEAGFSIVGFSPVPVVVGALGPAMLKVAGELADGTVTWLAGPKGVAEHIVPTLSKAAADAGRPTPRMIVGLPVALSEDLALAREALATAFARYPTLANYQNQMAREGAESVADVCLCGPRDRVLGQLRELRDAGATELWAVPIDVPGDPDATAAATTAWLASLTPDF